MTNWHDVVPALNSLLITLSIYVFLLLNIEIRVRIHDLESRRVPPPALPEARGGKQEARNPVPSASDGAPEDGDRKDGETPEIAKQPRP